ncbi:phosphoglycolate phosphatase [Chromobacterium sp. IIBBL 290-4]|uniref:phosphoglycolate phosphatase n=1 Tax=Chromobacterium sp. IIBBL 290-4 TaxID=2953890 RepID=UPI0020B73095|nr:phosphoglycolate phosphatase [Chromobacterium sp. IIBBL 290-4]UTH73650.1 phosphoglycolate phosphatase [Chromobacterium sp. IIBBL 290-4]
MNLKHIQAVAFDLDGTLVDSIPDLAAAANAMREHLGLPPLDAERIKSHVGDGIASLVHRAITDERHAEADGPLWERGYRFFVQHYRGHLCDLTTVYAGVRDGLGLLRARKLPLVLITNKSERLAVPLVEELGLRDHFSLILGGDTLAEKKPSALPLLHACQVLGIAPKELAMVGDSPNDVAAARAAGSVAIAVSYGYADAATLGADLTIGSVAELYDLMKND